MIRQFTQVAACALFVVAAASAQETRSMLFGRVLDPQGSALPGQYWATGTTRNDAVANNLNANVANPFFIGNLTARTTRRWSGPT